MLQRSASITHEIEYFPGNMEGDCVSQIFLEIAKTNQSLIRPSDHNGKISLHAQFQIQRLTRVAGLKTDRWLDIAIVKCAEPKPRRKDWGEYMYNLVGVIEVKRNFGQKNGIEDDLQRLRKLLNAWPEAFGILVVTYWNKGEREKKNALRTMSRINGWGRRLRSRMNVFCESNCGENNKEWDGAVLNATGIRAALRN